MTNESETLWPAELQPALPMDRLLREEEPGAEAIPFDAVFVGGGPAGLAGAIALAQRARASRDERLRNLEIGVIEKAQMLGEHCLSGAVVNPRSLKTLFPETKIDDFPFRRPAEPDRVYLLGSRHHLRLPTPPTMRNRGNYVASICEIVRWLGERAEELGVHLLTGFAAEALLIGEGRVRGLRTTAAGLDRRGEPGPSYLPPTDIAAQVTVLAEGCRGALTQAWQAWQSTRSPNPQIYALGVKELWRVERAPEGVVHTLGWPLPKEVFGGSFLYPMGDDLVALGLVAGLDYPDAGFDVHERLQTLKDHPLLRRHLRNGELLEWGAKTIPEGGFHSIPDRLVSDGLMVVGDSAGLVDVPSLKGIHHAIESGRLAAEAGFEALEKKDCSAGSLARYDSALRSSFVAEELFKTRNMRLAFKKGFFRGGALAALMTLTGGRFPGARIPVVPDAEEPRRAFPQAAPSRPGVKGDRLGVSKVDGVFRSGNQTRDDIPSHLLVPDEVSPELASFYSAMCPAGVYEREGERLVVNAPNCIDCKTTDVLGPRWLPREGGTGPRYRRM